jgi:hypothetical protein
MSAAALVTVSCPPNLPATQRRLMAVLSDQDYHTLSELRSCLYDPDMAVTSTLRVHLYKLRMTLRRHRQDVACEKRGGLVRYRLVCD